MTTLIIEHLDALQNIIVDDVKSAYFKTVLTKGKLDKIPTEFEENHEYNHDLFSILDLLMKCRFEFDLNFVTDMSEFQGFYDDCIRDDTNTIKIRTIINWVNAFYIRVGYEKWTELMEELNDVYGLNSSLNIDTESTCYDDTVLNGGSIFTSRGDKNVFTNNPWLAIVGLIKFIPATVIIGLTQPETMDKW